jgi:hypothetical protein
MSTGTIHATAHPIAAVLDFDGVAMDDYQRLCERLNPTRRHRRLQGCLFHWVKSYPEGFRVIEFWSGRELFDWFLDNEFRPLLRELGLVEPHLTIESVPEDAIFGIEDETEDDDVDRDA